MEEFVKELNELCRKHGMFLDANEYHGVVYLDINKQKYSDDCEYRMDEEGAIWWEKKDDKRN